MSNLIMPKCTFKVPCPYCEDFVRYVTEYQVGKVFHYLRDDPGGPNIKCKFPSRVRTVAGAWFKDKGGAKKRSEIRSEKIAVGSTC